MTSRRRKTRNEITIATPILPPTVESTVATSKPKKSSKSKKAKKSKKKPVIPSSDSDLPDNPNGSNPDDSDPELPKSDLDETSKSQDKPMKETKLNQSSLIEEYKQTLRTSAYKDSLDLSPQLYYALQFAHSDHSIQDEELQGRLDRLFRRWTLWPIEKSTKAEFGEEEEFTALAERMLANNDADVDLDRVDAAEGVGDQVVEKLDELLEALGGLREEGVTSQEFDQTMSQDEVWQAALQLDGMPRRSVKVLI